MHPQVPPVEGTTGNRAFVAPRAWSDAVAASFFGLVAIAIFAVTVRSGFASGRSGSIWGIGLPALAIFGGIAFVLARRFLDTQSVLKLSDTGIKGRGLERPLRWHEVDDVELQPAGSGARLVLHVRNAPGVKPRQVVPLHRLGRAGSNEAFEAVLSRLQARRAALGLGESRTARNLREAAAFQEKLAALTPSTWALTAVVGLNVGVWLLQVGLGVAPLNPSAEVLLQWGGNSAWAVVLQGEVWRMLTATFLHGGLMHLALNMAGLWEPGKLLARQLGNGTFLLVYLASALCGSAASLHFSAQSAVSVGASGAVFGILGALVASGWKYRRSLPEIDAKRLWSGPGFFMAYALLQGFANARVDNAAHVGGLLAGGVLGLLAVTRFDADRAAQRLPQAALGGFLAVVAVLAGLLTTPIPKVWHGPLFDSQHVLERVAPRFDAVVRGLEALRNRTQGNEDFRAYVATQLVPGCAGIRQELGQVRLPLWEHNARAAAAMTRWCELMPELGTLAIAPDVPADRPAVQARLAVLGAQMLQVQREMEALKADRARQDKQEKKR